MWTALQKRVAIGLLSISPLMICSNSRAGGFFQDFIEPYVQRIDGVTPGAGNARDINAVAHTIDPWPRNVGNRRIPANGERMSGAIERYRDIRRQPLTPAPLTPTAIGLTGPASSATSAAPVAAPPPQ